MERYSKQQGGKQLSSLEDKSLSLMKTGYSLEVIATHFAIEAIALQAFETPIGEILTGIVVFACIFTR